LLGYNDPADRFIAATAKAYDMTLVTADKRLLGLQGLKVLANI
jgi:PIN domain nuclease of toxin-antitoxin system